MLAEIGAESAEELFEQIPAEVRLDRALDLPDGMSEQDVFEHLRSLAARNADADSELCFLGAGMYDHYVPALVDAILSRSEFLTPYTPYQPEVSQGGLQAMFEFQTCMSELTALPVSNASMYEGPSSVASAAYLALGAKKGRRKLVVSRGLHPHSRETLDTYARGYGAEVVEVGIENGLTSADELASALDDETAAVFVQNPNFLGGVEDLTALASAAHDAGAMAIASVDPMTLGVLRPPGECGIDVAVGEGQPLGGRLDYGGPSFGFFCATEEHIRRMPGRIAGETTDVDGRRGFVLALPDSRAAHPPREGDPQHLHLAGADRARRRASPRLARKARPGRARRAHGPAHRLRAGDPRRDRRRRALPRRAGCPRVRSLARCPGPGGARPLRGRRHRRRLPARPRLRRVRERPARRDHRAADEGRHRSPGPLARSGGRGRWQEPRDGGGRS